ncbi:DUF5674 family protein [Anabaena catenula]|uniref:DUF5674 family protein n=1 Tax=Anabaena catenula TaxID=1296320 RepID=UPI001F54FC06|nr:DUF5674 family protein [Anabaena catenula]
MIKIIRSRATPEQIEKMLEELKFYIKVAVDLERRVLAGGGEMHFYCEQTLLEDGNQQQDIWAASFMRESRKIIYESIEQRDAICRKFCADLSRRTKRR